jgi:acetylornithine deacetylase/succinyl-diaminopimelate desuccinylase-like protein
MATKTMEKSRNLWAKRATVGRLQPMFILLVLAALSFSAFAETQLDDHLGAIAWPPYQDETVKLMREYLRIDTSNPPGNELAAAEFFHRLFEQAGIPNTIYPYAPGRANIYAVLKGDGELRPLVLLNHMDVVRADPAGFNSLEVTPELDATQHAANERVPIEQLRRGVKIFYEVVARAANQ